MWWFVSCLMFWPIIKILVGFEDQARPTGRTGSCRWRAAFAKVGLIWWLCCCCHWWWWWWWLTIISGLSLGTTWGEATSRPLDPAILLPQAINPELSIWSIILDTTSLIIIGDDYKNIIKKVCQFIHRHHHHSLQHFDHGQRHPGVSAVSSESCCSRKSSIARDFSFSSLSNFQVSILAIKMKRWGDGICLCAFSFKFVQFCILDKHREKLFSSTPAKWAALALRNNPNSCHQSAASSK